MGRRPPDDGALVQPRDHLAKPLDDFARGPRPSRRELRRIRCLDASVDAGLRACKRTGNKNLLAPFEKTLRYNSQIAEKAAQTRRKNAEAKVADGNSPEGQDTP